MQHPRWVTHTILAGLLLTTVAFAQRPQLTWQGYVDGGATIFVQGRKIDVQGRTTGAVDRLRSRFVTPLPAVPQTVEVKVRKGTGNVSIVEQPTHQNDYSAVVEIDNRTTGAQHYTLDFFWNPKAKAAIPSKEER